MDPRIERHAEILVDHSTRVGPGDEVLVKAPSVAEDLVVAIYEELGKIGAKPIHVAESTRATRRYMRAIDEADFELIDSLMAAVGEADVNIVIRGSLNTHETGDVAPEKNAAWGVTQRPIQDAMLSGRWCATQFPAAGNAQDAEMSTEAYEAFVWSAINKDWDAHREFQDNMVEILDPADEVRIVSGEETDVVLSVDGMNTINDYGEKNLPGGEVFTAPVPDSVEGTVHFDKPLMAQDREVQDVRLTFENGEVVEFSATKNEEVLAAVLNTDPGAKRVGELGIGMNRDIDRFTYNMLFDEKMGDTVHLALGLAYDETVGEDRQPNDSSVHLDMIVDMSEDSIIEIDGDVVQRNGTFRFEE